MGWTGKAGYYARERERGAGEDGDGEAFMGKMDDGRTDGEKRADEKRRRGGNTWRSLHAAQRKAATAALCERGSRGRMEEGAHLTPMEWAKERASEHDPRGARAFRCIRQAGLR